MNRIEKIELTKSDVSEEDLRKYKSMVLGIMKDFHAFLVNHEIKYSLVSGSLLGAIRHNGFIPWDDDIDIILERKEFTRLLAVVDEFNSDIYLVVKPLDGTPLSVPRNLKIYDKRAQTKEYGAAHLTSPFIDVFSTLDICPEKKKDLFKYRYYTSLYSFKTGRINAKVYLGRHSSYGYLLNLISHLYSKKTLARKIQRFYEAETPSEYCISSFGDRCAFKKKWFQNNRLHKFEDTEFCVCNAWDECLREEYGDYMTPPPVEKQNTHHLQSITFDDSYFSKGN